MIYPFENHLPVIDPTAVLLPGSRVIGQVTIGPRSSIWFNTVVRGDDFYITIGEGSNVQDNSTLHITGNRFPLVIGDNVTIGHNAIVHACTVGSRCLIGMGSILLDGCVIGDECIIAAGAVVTPGTTVPPRSLVMGNPGKVRRPVTDDDLAWVLDSGKTYERLAATYRAAHL